MNHLFIYHFYGNRLLNIISEKGIAIFVELSENENDNPELKVFLII